MPACSVSTHSRPKAAGRYRFLIFRNTGFQLTAARRRLETPAVCGVGGAKFQLTAARRRLVDALSGSFSQSPFQLTAARRRLAPLPNKRAGELKFQLTAARRRLVNHRGIIVFVAVVSTHSRPKAAGTPAANSCSNTSVSTHSRPKAAGLIKVLLIIGFSVSTHSRPKAAGLGRRTSLVLVARFNSQPPEGGWNLKLKNFLLH